MDVTITKEPIPDKIKWVELVTMLKAGNCATITYPDHKAALVGRNMARCALIRYLPLKTIIEDNVVKIWHDINGKSMQNLIKDIERVEL